VIYIDVLTKYTDLLSRYKISLIKIKFKDGNIIIFIFRCILALIQTHIVGVRKNKIEKRFNQIYVLVK